MTRWQSAWRLTCGSGLVGVEAQSFFMVAAMRVTETSYPDGAKWTLFRANASLAPCPPLQRRGCFDDSQHAAGSPGAELNTSDGAEVGSNARS